MNSEIHIEIIWIAMLTFFSIVLCGLPFGFGQLLKDSIEIQMHDIYFEITPLFIVAHVFFLFTFVTFGFREIKLKFEKSSANIILLSATSGLIMMTTILIREVSVLIIFGSDLTLYPPLSALPGAHKENNEIFVSVNKILLITQFLLLAILIFISIMTGKKIKKNSA